MILFLCHLANFDRTPRPSQDIYSYKINSYRSTITNIKKSTSNSSLSSLQKKITLKKLEGGHNSPPPSWSIRVKGVKGVQYTLPTYIYFYFWERGRFRDFSLKGIPFSTETCMGGWHIWCRDATHYKKQHNKSIAYILMPYLYQEQFIVKSLPTHGKYISKFILG